MSQEEIERTAEIIVSKHVRQLMDRIERLELSNAELIGRVSAYIECLNAIQSIRWGYDGDCGALKMINRVI